MEIRNGTYGKHVVFCPPHTPILFKSSLKNSEKRSREEIEKFVRVVKRTAKDMGVVCDDIKIQEYREKEVKSKKEIKKTLCVEDALKYIHPQKVKFLEGVKQASCDLKDYSFIINLKKEDNLDNEMFKIKDVLFPKKSILINK